MAMLGHQQRVINVAKPTELTVPEEVEQTTEAETVESKESVEV